MELLSPLMGSPVSLQRILALVTCCSSLGMVQFVYFGIIQSMWAPKPTVNRLRCGCECWDTIFKGSYEYPVAQYKHVYFNVTRQTFFMWILTVFVILITYEVCCHVVRVLLSRRFRFSMLILFLSTVHSHYYSWWVFWGYLNDDFYSQWNHQLMFTLTEGISTAVVLYLLDSDVTIKSGHLLTIFSIAVLHLLVGGMDQFVINVVFLKGGYHQIARDIAFLSVDFLYVIVSLIYMYFDFDNNNLSLLSYCSKRSRDTMLAAVCTMFVFYVSTHIL